VKPLEITDVEAELPQEEVSLDVCNTVISSELFVNSISKAMF
jgi:hypothetical protein